MVDASQLKMTHWLEEPALYESLSRQISVTREDYFSAVREILDVFPVTWIEKECVKITQGRNSLAEFSLYPVPDHWLTYHPVPLMLSSRAPKAMRQICELIKLGRDLCVTKDLPRTQSLRIDLQDFNQYLGRLFELEVLAAWIYAGMHPEILKTRPNSRTPDFKLKVNADDWIFVEVTHKRVPIGMAIATRLAPGMAFKEFGALQVRIRAGACAVVLSCGAA